MLCIEILVQISSLFIANIILFKSGSCGYA